MFINESTIINCLFTIFGEECRHLRKNKLGIFFHVVTIIGILMMESPIILLANRIEPKIFGFPFLIAWILFWWFICTLILLIAYQMDWGRINNRKKEV